MTSNNKRYKIGIVLSGGAMRGFAHLGALKALKEEGIEPDVISGVSAGSIVGALYADGYEPDEIMEMLEEKNFFGMVKFTFRNPGFLDMSGLEDILKENLRAKTFDDLKKPLYISATNLKTGNVEYFNEGTIIDKVLASSSIPVIFKPVTINNQLFVDGGLVNNLPVEPLREISEKLIGVNVNPLEEEPDLDGIKDVAIRSFHIGIASNAKAGASSFDYYIEPQELRKYGYFNVNEGPDIFKIGYEAARRVLSEQ